MARTPDTSLQQLSFPPATARARERLFHQAFIAVAVMTAFLWWSASRAHGTVLYLGLAVCVLSLLPALVWTKTMDHNYPFFEIFLATNLTSYGLPLLNEQGAVQLFDDPVREKAALMVILFVAAAALAFYLNRGRSSPPAWWNRLVLDRPHKQWMLRGLVLTTAYSLVVPYFYSPPSGINGILRAVAFGIGTSCTFILTVIWGLGRLKPAERTAVVLCLLLQFVLLSSSLILRDGASIVLLAFVGYFFGARRIPYLALAAVIAVIAVLNIGKYDLRQAYWTDQYHATPQITQLPSFYADWFQAGLHPKVETETKAGTLLLERNSLLQILCLVIARSPDYQPYLYGKTYAQIPGQFVPRLFWPEKPRGHISTYTLSIYYGLQDAAATYETTIAFGFLPEAYANFGLWGVAGLGLVFGIGFRKLTLWSAQSPLFSYGGLAVILVTAWSFQTELTLSAWLASLFQGAVSVFAFAFVFRRFQEATG